MIKYSNNDDSLLIKMAQDGSEGAFNFLMTKYYPRVYGSLYSFTKSKEDSEDLAQQTFVKVWQQIDTFRGDIDKVENLLQGQITSDIKLLGNENFQLSSICNQKGEVMAGFFFFKNKKNKKIINKNN